MPRKLLDFLSRSTLDSGAAVFSAENNSGSCHTASAPGGQFPKTEFLVAPAGAKVFFLEQKTLGKKNEKKRFFMRFFIFHVLYSNNQKSACFTGFVG